MNDLTFGESGRPRIAHDRYVEPLESVAGFAIESDGIHDLDLLRFASQAQGGGDHDL